MSEDQDTPRAARDADETEHVSELQEEIEFQRARAARAQADLEIQQMLSAQHQSDLEAALESERAAHERLLARRSVTVALKAASLTKPLIAYVRRLKKRAGETPTKSADLVGASQLLARLPGTLDRLANAPSVTVVVPIFNAVEHVEAAVESVLAFSPPETSVLLLDDGSTDSRIKSLLERLAADKRVRSISRESNLGFAATVNEGLRATSDDVVVLNSDVVVGPRWLANLRLVAYSRDDIGSATAISDNAGAFSVPGTGFNAIPSGLTAEGLARLVMQTSLRLVPDTPTAHGFCMYLKRSMIEEVGLLDEVAFPRGYGEENDLSRRAVAQGWRHVVDDATYVHHAQAASFGAERDERIKEARSVIDTRYPDYGREVKQFLHGSMQDVREHVGSVLGGLATHRPVRPRVLFVIHEGSGGTLLTNSDLMREAASRDWDVYLATSNRVRLRIYRLVDGDLERVEEHRLDRRLGVSDIHDDEYRSVVSRWLIEHSIELVHIRHLLKHTLDLPDVCSLLGIPTVLSFHDYYYICPTVHLLDESNVYCGGTCTSGPGPCPVPGDPPRTPALKHAWVYDWRGHVREMISDVDVFVTTTDVARRTYLSSFPDLERRSFATIEHGRDLVQHRLGQGPVPGEKVRILVLGNQGTHKGPDFIRELKTQDEAGRLEFHFLGSVPDEFRDLGVVHGKYDRDGLSDLVKPIGPHFVGLFSIWAETYSHTLTEAWSLGVPVLASSLGALGERVESRGGGWLLDIRDPAGSYSRILQIADEPSEYQREAGRASVEGLPSVSDMYREYDRIYGELLRRHSSVSE